MATSEMPLGPASLHLRAESDDGEKRLAEIRRAKVGYSQIQRQDKMALSASYAFTFTIDRNLLTKDRGAMIAGRLR